MTVTVPTWKCERNVSLLTLLLVVIPTIKRYLLKHHSATIYPRDLTISIVSTMYRSAAAQRSTRADPAGIKISTICEFKDLRNKMCLWYFLHNVSNLMNRVCSLYFRVTEAKQQGAHCTIGVPHPSTFTTLTSFHGRKDNGRRPKRADLDVYLLVRVLLLDCG